jgi:hypothetical protein
VAGVAEDRDVADAFAAQGQDQRVAGRVVADLADELNDRTRNDGSPGDRCP